jgi:hypothetical protein
LDVVVPSGQKTVVTTAWDSGIRKILHARL